MKDSKIQYPCVIVATKCDLKRPIVVTEEEGQELASAAYEGGDHGMHFFTSAKEDWGVTEAFQKIATLIVPHNETRSESAQAQNARKRKNCIIT